MRARPSRYRVALLLALTGVALSAYIHVVDARLHAGSGYTSFCNLGPVVNCDAVIGSRYGHLLGLGDEVLGLAAFAVGAVLALPGALGAVPAELFDVALLGLASGSLGFALALLGIQLFVLHKVCLLCLSIDVIALAWFVTTLPLAARLAPPRRTLARAVVAAGLVVALGAGAGSAVRGGAGALTAAEVQASDPRFYDLYTKLPVRPLREVAGGEEHTKGNPDAPVTIVEFSDFECPACAEAFRDLKDLLRSRDDVRVVFRYFPLDASCNAALQGRSPHPDACLAAFAAECAGEQHRFWEYHDLLFENQRALDRDSLFRYARDLGLDIAAFRACLDAPATREQVERDVAAGIAFGVASTPTLFINGRTVDGALERPYYDYALAIEKHALEAQASRGGG
ncbi:MAG TPA: thioredoxin domain-containing protein [Candidatus Binatia bacterium]|nr:thioredoxin domain-containing protein [Candidatus Binatia bacterium]